MRVAVLTANIGEFEQDAPQVAQIGPPGVSLSLHPLTDAVFPRRPNMSARFQARIAKLLGWQLVPGYDLYVWYDAQFRLSRPDSVTWLLGQLGRADLVVFRHPTRTTIAEEAAYVRERIQTSQRLMRRYLGEFLDEQMAVFAADPEYVDNCLYAAGVLAYRNTPKVQAMMRDWWYYVSRYHVNDQLQLPYVVQQHHIRVSVIDADVFQTPYFGWTRGKYRG